MNIVKQVNKNKKNKMRFKDIENSQIFKNCNSYYIRIHKQDVKEFGLNVNAVSLGLGGATYFGDDETVYLIESLNVEVK